MKSRYLGILFVCATFLTFPAVAGAQSLETVANFAQTAILTRAGGLTITDGIDYDFGGSVPHEIAYNIPLAYHDDQGREFRVGFKLVEAKLDGHILQLHPTVTTATANFLLPPGQDPTTTRHYQLRYTLAPVVLSGPTADILKHSVTGLSWSVPISRASLRLETPVAPADNVTCYTGSQGSTTGGCEVAQTGNVATVTAFASLTPGQSLNIFCDFARGSFTSYLDPYEAHPISPVRLILGTAAVTLGGLAALVVAVLLYRRRWRSEIVGANTPDYTNANEVSKDQAHRK